MFVKKINYRLIVQQLLLVVGNSAAAEQTDLTDSRHCLEEVDHPPDRCTESEVSSSRECLNAIGRPLLFPFECRSFAWKQNQI
jgi:hypothetical protein